MRRVVAAALLLAACAGKETPRDLAEKTAALHSSDAVVRGSAAYAIAQMGHRALPAAPDLIPLLADDTELVREPQGVHTSVSAEADAALRAIGDEKIDPALLIDALKRLPWNGRDNVAEHLKYSADPRAIPAMIDAILTPGEELLLPPPDPAAVARASIADSLRVAAEAAQKHGTKVVVPQARLIAALKDENPSIRKSAATALHAVGDPTAVDPLLAILRDPSADRELRIVVPYALSGIRDPRVVPALSAAASDADTAVRGAAIRGLGECRDPGAVPALKAALADSDSINRSNAVAALAKAGGSSAVPALLGFLGDGDGSVRDAAVRGLGDLRDARATDPLIALLEREQLDVVRSDIAAALLQITHEDRGKDPAAWKRWRTRKSWEFWK